MATQRQIKHEAMKCKVLRERLGNKASPTLQGLAIPHCHAPTQMVLNSRLPMVRDGSGWVFAKLE